MLFAHEAELIVKDVKKATKPESWEGAKPFVYVQTGVWYGHAYNGRAHAWGHAKQPHPKHHISKVKALRDLSTRLKSPDSLYRSYYDDLLSLVQYLQKLKLPAIALGTLPEPPAGRCRQETGLGCDFNQRINGLVDRVMKNLSENGGQDDKGAKSPVFVVDWASPSVNEQSGGHTDHKAGILGIQRLLSVICPSRAELRAAMEEQELQTGDAPAAQADKSCAHAAVFTPGCGTNRWWPKMIARRCNVSTFGMEAAQVSKILEDVATPVDLERMKKIQLVETRVNLQVVHEVQHEPLSARVVTVCQTVLLVFSVLVLFWVSRAKSKMMLPAPSAWLHLAPGETCWAAMHEGIGQVHVSIHAMRSSLSCMCCCITADGDITMKDLDMKDEPMVTQDYDLSNGQSTEGTRRVSVCAERPASESDGASRQLDAITGARLIASLHVAATHLARLKPPAAPCIYLFQWGFTWVPWFFMLSGYILAYARLSKTTQNLVKARAHAKPQHMAGTRNEGIIEKERDTGEAKAEVWQSAVTFCHRRLASVYPLYLLSVIIALAALALKGKLFAVRPSALIAQIFLIQSWLPSETEYALQSQCWFLSAIIPFWLLHQSILTKVERLSTHSIVLLLGWISLLPWLFLVLLPNVLMVPLDWYSTHKWQVVHGWVDVAVVVLKFHPVCYLHIYVFGMALAVLYVRLQQRDAGVPWPIRHGAVIAYALLFLIFTLPVLCPPARKLLCRLGGLAPLQGLLLLGLSEGHDPIAKLLQSNVFATTGAWSFGIYIFHFEVLALWGGIETGQAGGIGYWMVLLAVAALAHHYVQVPWGTDQRQSMSLRFAVASVLVVAIMLSSVPGHVRAEFFSPRVQRLNPSAIVYRGGAVDFRLNLRVAKEEHELAFADWLNGGQGSVMINPSLAQDPDNPSSIWIAARIHRKDTEELGVHSEELAGIFLGYEKKAKKAGAEKKESKKVKQEEGLKNKTVEKKAGKRPAASNPVGEAGGGGRGNTSVSIVKWNSRVTVGVMDLKTLTVGAQAVMHPLFFTRPSKGASSSTNTPFLGGEEERRWVPCTPPPVRVEGNNSVTITFSTGPEDPRLYFSQHDRAMHMSVFSYEPGAETDKEIPLPCADRQSYGRMYETVVSPKFSVMTTEELTYDDPSRFPIEKNWMHFEHNGMSHYIRSLQPFVVLASSRNSQGLKEVKREEVMAFRLAAERHLVIHGGSNAVLISHRERWRRSGMMTTYYLGTFHTRDAQDRYRNYAFAFQPSQPFAILGITPQLPLVDTGGRMNAFLSGLLVASPEVTSTVFFSYGAGDEESRVLSVPLEEVEGWLFPSEKDNRLT